MISPSPEIRGLSSNLRHCLLFCDMQLPTSVSTAFVKLLFSWGDFPWLFRVISFLLPPICRITESHPIRILISVFFLFFLISLLLILTPLSPLLLTPNPSTPCRVWWSSCRTYPRCTGVTRKWASSWLRPTDWSSPSQTHPTTTRDDEPKCCHAPASSSSSSLLLPNRLSDLNDPHPLASLSRGLFYRD